MPRIHYYVGPSPAVDQNAKEYFVRANKPCGIVVRYYCTTGEQPPRSELEERPNEYCKRCFGHG